MAIRMTQELANAIRRHGEETYPNECCGFLLGKILDGTNSLVEIYRARNEWEGSKLDETARGVEAAPGRVRESERNRYLITPEQYKQADSYARDRGLGIIGYYHSHPDHPAAPSGYDLDHSCWPGESYIIVSIQSGRAADMNSFTKPDYTKFEEEEMLIEI